MATNSSKALPRLALAVRLTGLAEELLRDFANTREDAVERFESKWYKKTGRIWQAGTGREVGASELEFGKVQKLVREIWEGKHQGYEQELVARGLSLDIPRQEEGWIDSSLLLFHVSWELGCVWASPRDLGDYVWLSLLQYSHRLAVCANKDCPTPYFVRKKSNQKFCEHICALPAQREFKREWFREHGDEWRQKWLKKRKRSATEGRKGR